MGNEPHADGKRASGLNRMSSLRRLLLLVLSLSFGNGESETERLEEARLEGGHQRPISPPATSGQHDSAVCRQALTEITAAGDEDIFTVLSVALHRNGEPDPCGHVLPSIKALENATKLDMFSFESLFTAFFVDQLKTNECGSTDNATAPSGLSGFCDMGPLRTVIQPDYDKLIRLPQSGSLPCRFYTREGLQIDSLSSLAALARKAKNQSLPSGEGEQECDIFPTLHIYAVPAGRMFMFAPAFVGDRFIIDHIPGAETIAVETMSLSPQVFELSDFFSKEEAAALIQEALSETSETHKLHRSTTGATDGKVYSKRTSDNAWITHSDLALRIKKRCLDFLGFHDFWESHTDGIQVLRYQNGQAYVTHKDYLTNSNNENYNYDSSGVGGNRYATILLYMSDMDENSGGETVFEKAWPVGATNGEKSISLNDKIRELRESGQIDLLREGSWEEHLTALCRTRLSIQPKSGRAVLFYSQHPNGVVDDASLHGACPALAGTKWAANLWVFSAPRPEFDRAPLLRPKEPRNSHAAERTAEFRNTGVDSRFDKAELFYDGQTSFGQFGPSDPPIRVNTYVGHHWHVMVDGTTLQEFVITDTEEEQVFKI